jgi:hypothetical protein
MNTHNIFNNFHHVYQNLNEYNIDVNELTNDYIKAEQPKDISISLKPHQLTLLKRCLDYENNTIKLNEFSRLNQTPESRDEFKTSMGVIADRVGSGKSYVILSIIMSNNVIQKDNTIIKSCGMNNIIFFLKDVKPVVKTNMLVIPHNLCSQWENYIKTFNSKMNYKIFNKHKIISNVITDNIDITQLDLIVVTSTFFNQVCKLVSDKNVKLQRIFFDEVDNLNIPGCFNVHANFYWFVTASYGNLLYPKGFSKYDNIIGRHMWYATGIRNNGLVKTIFTDIYNNIPHEYMKIMIIKNSEAYIESSITLPEIRRYIIKSKTPHSINILHGIADKNIIDCLNAGDIDRAISHINTTHKGTEENIIYILIDKYNNLLANQKLRLEMTNNYIYESEEDKQNEIININKKIDELTNKINMITLRIENSDMCSICFDNIENKTVTPCCQNSFCFKCIHIWLSKKALCPLCKNKLVSNDLFVVSSTAMNNPIINIDKNEIVNENEFNEKFDKWKNFEILLKKKKGNSKILIFSNYDNTFTNIIPILNNNGITWDFIKGNGPTINCIVNKYKGTQLDVLLVNARHYATGMNLENTTDIVMFHKFETQMEQQVIGRAHRYGRTIPLNVHYLLYENETAASDIVSSSNDSPTTSAPTTSNHNYALNEILDVD